jgi:hypothetical protein
MTVTIDLRPEIEAGLESLAAEQGLSLAQYVRRVLEGQLPGHGQTMLSPGERAAAWRESVMGSPLTPPLSDEAISRESIYDPRHGVAVETASGMDFAQAAIVRRELGLDGLDVRLPPDFDDPACSRQVLGPPHRP